VAKIFQHNDQRINYSYLCDLKPNARRTMKNVYIFNILYFILVVAVLLSACNSPKKQNTIRIIHAGSLALVVKQAAEAYEEEHPDVKILSEAWGSKDGARQITELKKPCDVYISADDKIIEAFLMPEYASWSIPFAGNEMVLAYTSKSKFAGQLNGDNWFEFLTRPEVLTARSSPDADPCGVRAVLLMLLSDLYYNDADISKVLLEKDKNFMRPKEADLIAMLEKNTVDYLYIYKSIAVQHNFPFVELPDEINLSNPALSEWYAKVSFYTVGKTPGSKFEERGAPIVYGITIPTVTENPEGALDFILFFLNPEKGGAILEKNGQNILPPQKSKFYDSIPEELKENVLKMEN
jgi:molybdate/tungstate transport system substrate-binding protein